MNFGFHEMNRLTLPGVGFKILQPDTLSRSVFMFTTRVITVDVIIGIAIIGDCSGRS